MNHPLPNGHTVVVNPASQNFFFARRQGVSIQIDPQSHWWCAFLCSSTTTVDEIACTTELSGAVQAVSASGDCHSCGSLSVMGPWFFGVNVPQAFSRADSKITVTISGQKFDIADTVLFN